MVSAADVARLVPTNHRPGRLLWRFPDLDRADLDIGELAMTALTLHLPLPPPLSACFTNARGPGRVKTARYTAWIMEAVSSARSQLGLVEPYDTIAAPVVADYQFGKPDNRKQDVENRAKAVSDLLVRAGILVDDSQIIDLRLRWAAVEGVVVTIRPAREPACNPVWEQ